MKNKIMVVLNNFMTNASEIHFSGKGAEAVLSLLSFALSRHLPLPEVTNISVFD